MRQKAKVNRCIEPHGRDEREIAGYHDVLAPIHEQCEYINVTANAFYNCIAILCGMFSLMKVACCQFRRMSGSR